MWATTREGYRLHIDPRAAGRVAPLLRPLGLERLVRSQMASSPSPETLRQATARSLAGLARRSRYSGVMLYPNSTRSFAVFTAPAAGGPYRLLARPTASGELEVAVAFSPTAEDIPEFAAQPISGAGTVRWRVYDSVEDAIRNHRGRQGIYILEVDIGDGLGPRPHYVGQGIISSRMVAEVTPRMNSIRVMDPKARFSFRVGVRDGRSSLSQPQIETVVMRRARKAGHTLANNNYQSNTPMTIPAGRRVRLTHRGQAPRYLLPSGRRTQTLSGGPRSGSGRRYELAPPSSLGVGS